LRPRWRNRDLDHDALVGDVFARNRHRLARIALAILEHVLQWPSVDPAAGVDFVKGKIEALFPLCAVLRILAVSGPVTPMRTGSLPCANAGAVSPPAASASSSSRRWMTM